LYVGHIEHLDDVFPTHVGVYLAVLEQEGGNPCFPHACGGVPLFSIPVTYGVDVFPTHVGVYLAKSTASRGGGRFPHACGGVP